MSQAPHKNGSFATRCRFYHSKEFSYAEIAKLMGRKTDEVYFAIHGCKRRRHEQTAAGAIEELLAAGCDPDLIRANFGECA